MMKFFIVFLFLLTTYLTSAMFVGLNSDYVSPFPSHDPVELEQTLRSFRKLSSHNNQTLIHPNLTLKNNYSVYYCKTTRKTGIRFDFLVREGLLLHPNINLTSSPEDAQIIIMIPGSTNWKNSECNKEHLLKKIIVLDENDDPEIGESRNFLFIFKRSYVRRSDGIFLGYMRYLTNEKVFPMTYPVGNSYIRTNFFPHSNRVLQLLCTLRPFNSDPTRKRVYGFVKEYIESRTNNKHSTVNINKYQIGELSGESRPVISKSYFESMQTAKVLVTSNPSFWEGDFRLTESLAGGALILVDSMYTPRLKPFKSMKHFIIYDSTNKTDLFEKLDWAFTHPDEAELIALKGYFHALKNHRAQNLIDYVFNTYEYFLNNSLPIQNTGYYLRNYAIAQQELYKKST